MKRNVCLVGYIHKDIAMFTLTKYETSRMNVYQ